MSAFSATEQGKELKAKYEVKKIQLAQHGQELI